MVYVPDAARDLIAGTVGGWAQVVVGHPFDTIKVRLQTQPNPPKYHSGMHCLTTLIKEEGATAVYKGVTSPLAGIGICNAVVFTANGYFRRMLQGNDTSKPLTLPQIMLAGNMAGTVMAFFNCPIELLKVKLQVQGKAPAAGSATAATQPKPYKGVFDCGVRTFKAGGLRGLYRGITITLIRDVPSFACYFGAYELVKRSCLQARSLPPPSDTMLSFKPVEPPIVEMPAENTGMELCLAGGMAGIAAWLLCYPQDIVKSRMQSNPSYRTTAECFRVLLKEASGGNWRIFFRGFAPTLARAFPANAATFMAYEWSLKQMS
ncbi:hypothetical protein IWQ60_000257 [Tieghemiomyces parasiticus]|uniref:Uncharacterized protein n=1 Tax=Tieghemiomyces parasiticus TaxID=78921 RepID=A0A9W8AIU4_9FUNG|nr:hypothetical protein IWQ60_000257 [Tieghemiomyces parasiticus]